MRFVPLALLNTSLSGTLLLAIAGCGGRASAPLNTTTTAPGAAANSAAPPGTTSSTPTPPPSSTPTPSPSPAAVPAGTTISNIELMPGWESCDTCSGGGSIAFSMTQGLNSPQPGTTQFSLGPGTQWAHALWWKRLGTDPSPSHFVLTLDQYMENPAASFGIEYEANQIVDGEWYDFAIQCSFGYGIWQLWDPANQQWVPT